MKFKIIAVTSLIDVKSAPIFLLFEFAKLSLPMFHTPCGAPIFDHLLALCITRSLKLRALYDFWMYIVQSVEIIYTSSSFPFDRLHLMKVRRMLRREKLEGMAIEDG